GRRGRRGRRAHAPGRVRGGHARAGADPSRNPLRHGRGHATARLRPRSGAPRLLRVQRLLDPGRGGGGAGGGRAGRCLAAAGRHFAPRRALRGPRGCGAAGAGRGRGGGAPRPAGVGGRRLPARRR
ncbi:hypothetical protein APUTEX25_004329, partial [Auxenochlorella protothecoides]